MLKSLYKANTQQSILEELANAISHSIGVLLSIAALIILVTLSLQQNNPLKIISSLLFAGNAFLLYLTSTLYHSFQQPNVKALFQRMEHMAIYLLIAGSYSPFTLINLQGLGGGWLFTTVWALALLGILGKCFFFNRFLLLSLSTYLLLGWIVLFAIKPLYHALPAHGFFWLLAGGLAYTVGALFFVWERLNFSHLFWHLFVLAGTICHFFAILFYAIN